MLKKGNWLTRTLAAASLAALFASPALAADKADHYPLNVCPVSGKELGKMGEAIVKVYDGREVRFCCDGCPANFEKDQAASLAKLDQALIDAQSKDYPLDKCLNSGEALGDKPVSFLLGNHLVKTCCADCQKKLEADKAASIEKYTAAVAEKLAANYPADKCPISGEKLGAMGDPVNIMIGDHLIKLCCAGCEKGVAKDPAKAVATVWSPAADAAAPAADAAAAPAEAPQAEAKGSARRKQD